MGISKLPPPIIAGVTPPFYNDEEKGAYSMKVPFSSNKMVLPATVMGIQLRLRDGETDIELARINTYNFQLTAENSYAKFDLSNYTIPFVIGKYYKIQLAYISKINSEIGYFSTVSIIKCTAKPRIGISNLNYNNINLNTIDYIGLYSNYSDPSEKCYQYKFTLYDNNNNKILSTDWKLHNSNEDTIIDGSRDYYSLEYVCQPDQKYKIEYSVITTNGLVLNSPKYIIVKELSISSDLKADLFAKLDYDNGCINLWLQPNEEADETTIYSGFFVLFRSSSIDNYATQTQVSTLYLTGALPTGSIFHDFTVEHGQYYRYYLQQKNNQGIYSEGIYAINITPHNKTLIDAIKKHKFITEETAIQYFLNFDLRSKLESGICDIYSAFEDAFLFDGERQLKIRFNPKVTSFKDVVNEQKKTTLGSQYPFFFRTGNVKYKEFPISGLISYLGDENEFFMNRKTELKMDEYWEDTTDIIDDNIAYERKFKLKVLEWLNNGEIKLFRSPSEGNYLVRLTNISLTPNDSLSRMIHTFSCTADEIDSITNRKLIEYGFLNTGDHNNLSLRFYTIVFSDYIQKLASQYALKEKKLTPSNYHYEYALEELKSKNLIEGQKCQYIKFENCLPQKTVFMINSGSGMENFVIGSTGQYEMNFPEKDAINYLQIKDIDLNDPGQVTFGVWTTQFNTLDRVNKITQKVIIDSPTRDDILEQDQSKENTLINYIDTINDLKTELKEFWQMNFELNSLIVEINSLEQWAEKYNIYLYKSGANIYNIYAQERTEIVIAPTGGEYQYISYDEPKTIYIRNGTLNEDTIVVKGVYIKNGTVSAYKLIDDTVIKVKTKTDEDYYIDNLISNSLIIDKSTGKIYKFNYKPHSSAKEYFSITNSQDNVIENPTIESPIENIGLNLGILELFTDAPKDIYINKNNERIELLPTQIYFDGNIIDLAQTEHCFITPDITDPKELCWGAYINPLLVYTLVKIEYAVETDDNISVIRNFGPNINYVSLQTLKEIYHDDMKHFASQQLNLVKATLEEVKNVTAHKDNAYFYWDDDNLCFDRIPEAERVFWSDPNVYRTVIDQIQTSIEGVTNIDQYITNLLNDWYADEYFSRCEKLKNTIMEKICAANYKTVTIQIDSNTPITKRINYTREDVENNPSLYAQYQNQYAKKETQLVQQLLEEYEYKKREYYKQFNNKLYDTSITWREVEQSKSRYLTALGVLLEENSINVTIVS